MHYKKKVTISIVAIFITMYCSSILPDGLKTSNIDTATENTNVPVYIKSKETKQRKGPQLNCLIANTPEKRQKGFMYTKHIPKNTCILFVFPNSRILNFWMKNTFVPLSIAFFSKEKKLISISEMTPQNEEIVSSPLPSKYAIETNKGWFQKYHIEKGDFFSFKK